MDEFADRILVALADIGAQYHGKKVLIITHGWVLDVITRHINGLPRNAILNMKRKNGESLWVAVAGDRITAVLNNGSESSP
jgi:probable phosphoglycerate mutase